MSNRYDISKDGFSIHLANLTEGGSCSGIAATPSKEMLFFNSWFKEYLKLLTSVFIFFE